MLLPTSCQLPSSLVWLASHPFLPESTTSASGALTVLQLLLPQPWWPGSLLYLLSGMLCSPYGFMFRVSPSSKLDVCRRVWPAAQGCVSLLNSVPSFK